MIWIVALCLVCFAVCLPLFMYYKKTMRYHLAACYKSLGTLCSFLLALIAAVRLDPRCSICAVALFLYAVADYLLEFHLMLGAGFFLAGHICNIAFFAGLASVSGTHLIFFLILFGFFAFVFYRWKKQIGRQLPVFALYGVGLCLMSAFAAGCFSAQTLSGILIAVGGILFYFSDTLILRRILFPTDRWISWIIMISYYAALLLFGIACLQL